MVGLKNFIIFMIIILMLIVVVLVIPKKDDNLVPVTPTPTISNTPQPTPNLDATPTPPELDKEIEFTDVYLELVVRELMNKPIGAILESEVRQIKELEARVCAIRSIEDLKYFTSLERLDLYGNRISDISVLKHLTNLKYLDLSHNFSSIYVGDREGMVLEPLRNLTRLEVLYLDKNFISDINPLSSLVSLKRLSLKQNRISDVSPLKRCVNLEYLDLSKNYHEASEQEYYGVEDLTELANLQKLVYIDISFNTVEDITPLSVLSNLEVLLAGDNWIEDIECLRGHEKLRELDVHLNMISYFDAILEMPSLKKLFYDRNPIMDYYPIDVFEGVITPTPDLSTPQPTY